MQSFQNFLCGKRVALIGPAPSVLKNKNGDEIDDYDIVCRVNRALPLNNDLAPYIGTKTNILYNCLDPDKNSGGPYLFEEWKKLDWLVGVYPEIPPFKLPVGWFKQKNNGQIKNFRLIDKDIFIYVKDQMKTRPNTGTMAMIDLLMSSAQEIYISGFTFFQKGIYIKQYKKLSDQEFWRRENMSKNHNHKSQAEFMCKYLKQDSRVKTDKGLKDVIDSYT